MASAKVAIEAHTELVAAQSELAEAKVQLDAAKAGQSTTEAAPTSSTTTTLLPAATTDRVRSADAALTTALDSVTDQTPVVQAGVQVNSAALALEVAWLRVLADSGCLTEEQTAAGLQAITQYTAAVQSALTVTGEYTGPIDGIYGPETADAVARFQSAHGLPATGYVDRATAVAMQSSLEQRGGSIAARSIAHTAAVQTALSLAGFWTGPIDGVWTDSLTAALAAFQTDLGVPPTGTVDAATMEALRAAIAAADTPTSTTTSPTSTPAPSSTASSTASTTAPPTEPGR